ncbi:hypothetical protein DPMN_114544 [Dreissena polymorpha]|uniref:Uncharacterized protein n=1 Tax=Dreissena polymorpha TaxID=45954 RepID=A0A9D4KJN0_DREPO|nr:hypothetical protein DPMN_114544 [Dreissena polymorpha]
MRCKEGCGGRRGTPAKSLLVLPPLKVGTKNGRMGICVSRLSGYNFQQAVR